MSDATITARAASRDQRRRERAPPPALRRRPQAAPLWSAARSPSRSDLLAVLILTLVMSGYSAFTQTFVRVTFPISEEFVDPADPAEGNFRRVVQAGVQDLFPGVTDAGDLRAAGDILTKNTQFFVRDAVVKDPSVIGGALTMEIPVSDPFDQLYKGLISRDTPEDRRRLDDAQIATFDQLVDDGRMTRSFNWGLFFNSDSRFPEIAGLAGAIVGSFYALLGLLPDQLPRRHRRGDLSRGVRAEEPLHRHHRGQHQQPRGGAVDRLRPPRPRGLHPDLRAAALGAAGRRHGAGADDAAHDHHRHAQRHQGGAALDPRGGLRRRRLQAPGDDAPRAAAGAARAS